MNALQHNSLAEMSESALIHTLLGDAQWRSRVTNIHGIPDDAIPYPEIPLGNLGNGDVDILLVPPDDFDRATAIQAKRIKVHEPSFATEMPGKLSELGKLQQQVNLLAKLGFWQVYSFVFVVVDSRANNGNLMSYAGLTPPLRDKIEASISLEGLAPEVGLLHFEFVQPLDHYPLGAGTFSARLKRLAQPREQLPSVTEWVRQAVQSAKAQQVVAADRPKTGSG